MQNSLRLSLFALIIALMACVQTPDGSTVVDTPTLEAATVVLAAEVVHPTATPTETPLPAPEPVEPAAAADEASSDQNTALFQLTPIPTPRVRAYLADNIESSTFTTFGIVTGIYVNLRTGPGTDFDIVGRVYQNDKVEIVGRTEESDWWQVCCDDNEEIAWMTNQFLQPDPDASQVNVTYRVSEAPIPTAAPAVETENEDATTETASADETADGADANDASNEEASTDDNTSDDASTSEETDSSQDEGNDGDLTAIVNGDRLNMRGGPSTSYDKVGQVVLSTTVTIIGRNEAADWWQVCCIPESEDPAWVKGEFVNEEFNVETAIEQIPVIDVPEPATSERSAPATNTDTTQTASAAPAPAPAPPPGAGSEDARNLPAPGGFGAPGDVNPLTGLPLAGDRRGQRPVIVCINNDFAARPQFGTSQADVMYEYLMEGYGITRFSGVFYGDNVEQIGPVRSARLVNFYMGALYDAPLLCSGASDQVRFMLKNEAPFPYLDIDLDDPSNNKYSISVGNNYRTRVRTNSAGYRRWLSEWGEERASSIRGFTFGGLPGGAPATTVTIPYPSSTGSNVEYRYDAGSGRYLRYLNGEPHTDGNTGVQLSLENVIVQYVPHGATDIVEDSLGSTSIRLNLFGGNRAIVFRDGQAIEGSWQSNSRGDMPKFLDANGAEIPLKPGRTWISIVPARYEITY